MMIICQGPDTFRALRKAQELERAFRDKYDPAGYAVERLLPGKDVWKEVIQRANAVGLFASHKCIRVDNLWASCPKKERENLKRVFAIDPERVIVISLEEELDEQEVREFLTWPKAIRYEFPILRGTTHQEFAQQLAKELEATDIAMIKTLAQQTEGDSWLLWNEIVKLGASGLANKEVFTQEASSIFTQSDRYFFQPDQAHLFQSVLDGAEVLPVFLQQGRAGLRVKSGSSEGIPAFVARKWQSSRVSLPELKTRVAQLVQLTYLQRRGVVGESDLEALM